MIEILVIWVLAKRIGNIVEEKGRKSGWHKVLAVVLWFGGEIIGAIIGAIVVGADESAQCLVYLFALLGAAAGAGIAFLIANNLSPVVSPGPTSLPLTVEPVSTPAAEERAVAKEGRPASSRRLIIFGLVAVLLGPVLVCVSTVYPFATMGTNSEFSSKQIVVPAHGDLLFEIEPREGRYDYEVRSDEIIDVHYLDEEDINLYRAGQDYDAIERAELTRSWTGFTQMGGTTDYALRLINDGNSDATVYVSLTFFPLPSFGAVPFACGIGLLLFVGGIVAVVIGLVRKTDGRSPQPTIGENREG
jgi:hypothetical protein